MSRIRAISVPLAFALAVSLGIAFAWGQAAPRTDETRPLGTTAFLAQGLPATFPDRTLRLERITYPPGAIVPQHIHPGPELIAVESGALGVTAIKGTALLTRAVDGMPAADRTTAEPVEVGDDVVLQPGDSLFVDQGVAHTVRAVGDVPAVILTARLFVAHEEPTQIVNAEGTPVPVH